MASGSIGSLGSYTDLLCTDHRQPLLFYCKTCTKRICGYCVTGSHKTHNFVNADIEGEQLSMEYDNDADTESISSFTSNNITDNISEPPKYEETWAKDIDSNERDEQLKAFKRDISYLKQEMHKEVKEAMSTFDKKFDNRFRALLQSLENESKSKEKQQPSMESNSNLEMIRRTYSKPYNIIKHVSSYQVSEMYQQNQKPKTVDNGFPLNRLIPSRQQNKEVKLLRQLSTCDITQIRKNEALHFYPESVSSTIKASRLAKIQLPPLITRVLLLQSIPKEVKSTEGGILCFCDTELVGGYLQTKVLKMMDVAQTVVNIIVFNEAIAAPHCIAIHPTNNQMFCVTSILKEHQNYCIVNSVDTQTGHARKLFDTKEQLNCLAITKDGLILAGSNNLLLVYKSTGERPKKVKCKLRLHHISVCKSTGLIACCADGAVQVMDEHFEERYMYGAYNDYNKRTLGSHDAIFDDAGHLIIAASMEILVLDAVSGKCIGRLSHKDLEHATCLAINHNRELVIISLGEQKKMLFVKYLH